MDEARGKSVEPRGKNLALLNFTAWLFESLKQLCLLGYVRRNPEQGIVVRLGGELKLVTPELVAFNKDRKIFMVFECKSGIYIKKEQIKKYQVVDQQFLQTLIGDLGPFSTEVVVVSDTEHITRVYERLKDIRAIFWECNIKGRKMIKYPNQEVSHHDERIENLMIKGVELPSNYPDIYIILKDDPIPVLLREGFYTLIGKHEEYYHRHQEPYCFGAEDLKEVYRGSAPPEKIEKVIQLGLHANVFQRVYDPPEKCTLKYRIGSPQSYKAIKKRCEEDASKIWKELIRQKAISDYFPLE